VEQKAPRAARARDRVMRAAMDIIVDRGLDGLRLAEIARRANMSEGHVLYYFGTKNRILIETLLWSEAALTVRRREAIRGTAVGWDQLMVFVDLYLPRDFEDALWALWVEAWARRHIGENGAPLRETSEIWEQDLESLIDRGVRAGDFSAPPPSFTRRLIALMNGFAVQILERVVEREEILDVVLEQCRLELDPSRRTGSKVRNRSSARSG
jgi:AcrR family transcriptional regulator